MRLGSLSMNPPKAGGSFVPRKIRRTLLVKVRPNFPKYFQIHRICQGSVEKVPAKSSSRSLELTWSENAPRFKPESYGVIFRCAFAILPEVNLGPSDPAMGFFRSLKAEDIGLEEDVPSVKSPTRSPHGKQGLAGLKCLRNQSSLSLPPRRNPAEPLSLPGGDVIPSLLSCSQTSGPAKTAVWHGLA